MMQYSDSSASETSGTSGISGRDVRVRAPLCHHLDSRLETRAQEWVGAVLAACLISGQLLPASLICSHPQTWGMSGSRHWTSVRCDEHAMLNLMLCLCYGVKSVLQSTVITSLIRQLYACQMQPPQPKLASGITWWQGHAGLV